VLGEFGLMEMRLEEKLMKRAVSFWFINGVI
jgi:hypothetical protein